MLNYHNKQTKSKTTCSFIINNNYFSTKGGPGATAGIQASRGATRGGAERSAVVGEKDHGATRTGRQGEMN